MGFGTLFIGYFFLINISYFAYTDIIAAMVMLTALYRLKDINRGFFLALLAAGAFALYSAFELVLGIFDMFGKGSVFAAVLPYSTLPRYALLFLLTSAVLVGIRDVAAEVEAMPLSRRAHISACFSPIYLFFLLSDIPAFSAAIGTAAASYIYFALIIGVIVYVACNLVTIYRAYMQICMPGDEQKEQKPSRFGFVNKFRSYEEKKSREYAEYKLDRLNERESRKKQKKKKK